MIDIKRSNPYDINTLLLLLALNATQAHAQIIYTDVILNATYSDNGDTCHLDLDNNGPADYLLIRQDVPYSCGFSPGAHTGTACLDRSGRRKRCR